MRRIIASAATVVAVLGFAARAEATTGHARAVANGCQGYTVTVHGTDFFGVAEVEPWGDLAGREILPLAPGDTATYYTVAGTGTYRGGFNVTFANGMTSSPTWQVTIPSCPTTSTTEARATTTTSSPATTVPTPTTTVTPSTSPRVGTTTSTSPVSVPVFRPTTTTRPFGNLCIDYVFGCPSPTTPAASSNTLPATGPSGVTATLATWGVLLLGMGLLFYLVGVFAPGRRKR